MRWPLLLLSCCLLLACAVSARDPLPTAAATAPMTEVDYGCQQDSDCAVKNVGNCCGYYPACVNRDSPTFPDKVKADCEAEGRFAVCGFPEISRCHCVEQRCEAVTGPAVTEEVR